MFFGKKQGLMRLLSAVTLVVIFLPGLLRVYLAVNPGETAGSLLTKLVGVIPFGNAIFRAVSSVLTEVLQGGESLVDWMQDRKFSAAQFYSLEMGKMIFSATILSVILNVTGNLIMDKDRKGTLNRIADVVFLTFCVFLSALLTEMLFTHVEILLLKSEQVFREIFVLLTSGALGGIGIYILCVTGLVLSKALMTVAMNCLKMVFTYSGIIWLLLCIIMDKAPVILLAGAVAWIGLIGLLMVVEELILN